MRYISTRGEGPPLSFVEAMLAGLARDGGLYVPEFWPVFAPERIAALAGLPYAELALEILRPFVDDAIPEGDLARMTREAYGTFRHPAVCPHPSQKLARGGLLPRSVRSRLASRRGFLPDQVPHRDGDPAPLANVDPDDGHVPPPGGGRRYRIGLTATGAGHPDFVT